MRAAMSTCAAQEKPKDAADVSDENLKTMLAVDYSAASCNQANVLYGGISPQDYGLMTDFLNQHPEQRSKLRTDVASEIKQKIAAVGSPTFCGTYKAEMQPAILRLNDAAELLIEKRRAAADSSAPVAENGLSLVAGELYPQPGETIIVREMDERGRAKGLTDAQQHAHLSWDLSHGDIEVAR